MIEDVRLTQVRTELKALYTEELTELARRENIPVTELIKDDALELAVESTMTVLHQLYALSASPTARAILRDLLKG